MSDRGNNTTRPLRPTIASNRAARPPLTPRLAGTTATPPAKSNLAKTPPTVRSEPPKQTPRAKPDGAPAGTPLVTANITPRSSARKSRVDSSQSTPTQADEPTSLPRPTSSLAFAHPREERPGSISSLGFVSPRAARPRSIVSDLGSSRGRSPPVVRSPTRFGLSDAPAERTADTRFFHASDMPKSEPAPAKSLELKKTPTFVYADGKQEPGRQSSRSSRATSPVLSAVSEQRSSGPWLRSDSVANPPPLLSPALSTLSSTSPFFAAATGHRQPRSPSPSKENIHLSYRKGASQIFGTRPLVQKPETTGGTASVISGDRRGSLMSNTGAPHRKSPSLSSMDSGISHASRRRSATTVQDASPSTPIAKSATVPRAARVPPSIDTSLSLAQATAGSSLPPPTAGATFSPTKSLADFAADARRERKVLDLEISNSSLLAVNTSLEREVRRQKAELKRFRRLTRAGRFSTGMGEGRERAARFSEGLSVLGEGDERGEGQGGGYGDFGPPSGFTDLYDDYSASDSDDETESVLSGGGAEPRSPTTRGNERLDRDEKRLRGEMAKHKELLVQSQMMNQSLKRCTYTTEAMIAEGKRALEYQVRVSDVRLGGRILTGHELEEEDETPGEGEGREEDGLGLDVEDDTLHADEGGETEAFLRVWRGVGKLAEEGSEESGDRDSGIEVDRDRGGEVVRPGLLRPDGLGSADEGVT
ncbi:hypothetical protein LTR53_014062 [Teratosphaeriaceae sp. CCFEE 6253]|nr:hypothetical protein LTR53_014062 [Teratosphaeriaceae sp. CCFEE 6253]